MLKSCNTSILSPNNADTFMTALQAKVSKESRYKIQKGYNIEQESTPNPANLLTFPLSMQVSFITFKSLSFLG